MEQKKVGVLLVNIGSPATPKASDVRRYLREFLSDPRVIDIPVVLRLLLLYFFILPFRPQKTAKAYSKVWTKDGSPLLRHSKALQAALVQKLPECEVSLGMRYQAPSLSQSLEQLKKYEQLIIFPQYPQYASSSTGSCLEAIFDIVKKWWNIPAISVVPPFYDHPLFITAVANIISSEKKTWEHLLFSFHGLPERQIRKSENKKGSICQEACTQVQPFCYRSQCFDTAKHIANRLALNTDQYSVSFQSRLGRSPWIKPYTDLIFSELRGRGVKRLAIACPSFTADCLETIEEIGIRAQETWLSLGGESLQLIPCVNSHPLWVDACASIIRDQINQ
jgi:ferrochelatase